MGELDAQTVLAVLLAVAAVVMFTRTGWQGKTAGWKSVADKLNGKLTVAGFIPPPTMKLEVVSEGVPVRAVFAFPPDPRLTVVTAPHSAGEGAVFDLRVRHADSEKASSVVVDEEFDEKFIADGDPELLRQLWSPERRELFLSLVASEINTAEISSDGKSITLKRVGMLDTSEEIGAAVELVAGLAKPS